MDSCVRVLSCVVVALLFVLPATVCAQYNGQTNGLYLTPAEALPASQLALPSASKDSPVTISANAMGADQKNGIVVARGNVEVLQGNNILTADSITYYQASDKVVAEGNVSMLQPNGDVFFADKAELKDAMKRAVISDFKARLADNSVLVANSAKKINAATTQLESASYTPCNLCKGVSPFWQMNASKVTVNDYDERVHYEDAVLEFSGVPVFYAPFLSHPTPDASAKSGFGLPSFSNDAFLGAVAKAPYYWRIDEDKDVTLTPWVSSIEGPLLEADYRQLRDHGNYQLQGSITNPQARDAAGNEESGREIRGHIFALGNEQVADNTYVGFDVKRATDDTYLRRYGFGGQQALFSRGYAEYAQGRNFALAEAVTIQGLRSADENRTIPLVLPILQAYYETPASVNGTRYHLAADAQALSRDEGVDQRRFSITPGVTVPFISEGGQVITASARLRQDIYDGDSITRDSGQTFSGTTTRTLPQAALEWRYPLINTLARGALVVEPVLLGVAQTTSNNPDTISNEDSRLLELTDTNLFSINRVPGLDLFDSGTRVAYGVRSHYYDTSGVSLDGLLGQNYDVSGETPFPNSTREGTRFSDIIGRVSATYQPVSLAYRFATDTEDGSFNRNEIEFGFTKPWLSFNGSYRTLKNNRFLPDSREGIFNTVLPLTDNWSVYGGVRNDFELDRLVTSNAGLVYKNECFNFALNALRINARDRDLEPTNQITFTVGLKNLGEFGGN